MKPASSIHSYLPSFTFALYGACCLILQLATLQELLLVFAGHELFLGFSLASWMGWVGVGSWLASQALHRRLAWVPKYLLPLSLTNVILIRLSKCLFPFGMLVGLLPMLLLTFLLLAPMGLALGACFLLGCDWSRNRHNFSLAEAYLWDTVGAVIGGVLYTAAISGRLTTDWVIALLSIPAALVAAAATQNPRWRTSTAAVPILVGFLWVFSPGPRFTRVMQWKGYELISERVSRYSHLALARTKGITSLFENGVLASHFPDPAAYEELVHWPLLAHPHPRRILIIGGAATGSLAEILKHPVSHVDYVEMDPLVVQLLKTSLPSSDLAALRDSRVRLINLDGRRWLNLSSGRYDVILLQLPEPLTAQINRLYTLEAFQAARRHLTEGGIFAFAIPSSENYLSADTVYFNSCLYLTLKEAFPSVELISGDTLMLLASDEPLNLNPELLALRYAKRRLITSVVVPSYMPIKLDSRRRAALRKELGRARAVILNRDFFPTCYAYAWRVWLSKFVSPLYFLTTLALLAILAWFIRLAWKYRTALSARPQEAAIFALGAAGIVYETVLLLAFQSLAGYLYWQLGILFASFMSGLAAGSWWILPRLANIDQPHAHRLIRRTLLATGIHGTTISLALPLLRNLPPHIPYLVPFTALLAASALWLGIAFPLASQASSSRTPTRAAGSLYAADLWGAAVGAVFTSSALVPLIGLRATIGTAGLVTLTLALLLPRPR